MSKRNSFNGTVPSSAIETPGSRFSLASIRSNEMQATNAYCTNNFALGSNENISLRKLPVGVLDPMMLQEMENRANEVASQVNLMLDQIRSHMSEFSDLTLQTVNIYQEGTESLKEAFESSIENSANLIMKCDELDKNFGSLYALRDQV